MITYPEYKINNQTILQEQFDENYEPTDDEIREYAIYIGINPDKERHLLWLAKEGIMKPLPPGWKPCQEEKGELYYFNFDTGKASWDHPCDEIYKTRVTEERRKLSGSNTLLNTNPRDTLTQTGRSTSTVSDYLSGGKKSFQMGTHVNTPVVTRTEAQANRLDAQYVNSDNDEIEELMNSDNDDEEQSSDDFRRRIDFGIDPLLSARIERKEKEAITTSTMSASRTMNSFEHTDRKVDNRKDSPNHNNEENVRKNRAEIAAEGALRHPSTTNVNKHDDTLVTPREEYDLTQLRSRLEQSANEEKLQILEDNRIYIERLNKELKLAKEKEEQMLRDKMKADLASIEKYIHENIAREKDRLENRKQEELNNIKQNIEREKEDYQKKLRESMQSDLNVYKNSLDQHNNANTQIRSLQDKLNREKSEFEERLRLIENRHKNEIDDLNRRHEQIKADREKLEQHLKEKDNHCSTLQKALDQLRNDKGAVERKLQDAEIQLKAIDESHRQINLSNAHRSLTNATENNDDDDDDDEDDENFDPKKLTSKNANGFHDNDDAERLSDTDSDVVEMEQTLKELRQTQRDYMSLLPISNIDDKQKQYAKTATVDLTKLSVADVAPVVRNIRTINRNAPRMYESYETMPNQVLTDSGRWSNTMMSTLGNNTNSSAMYQTANGYQPILTKTNHWSSQPTLVTREAVLNAARKVFAPNVIDQLTSNSKSSTH
ncbi:unnamed protein product [Rotaria socialis]|uniref:WW domain-containing protein n=1 Tax=Rotaria socialis TaxID=392032 RepID=A0A817T1Z1_9BILA|nr:unnamed protein product [Rotaria socialis]CAF3255714.1 unnamed protein product [Rotaria socialis]CAF3306784.1 unnamed protein product [Rotaria socialis]CAF3325968.1 unnamed protein product [Rotaria socialis]CAF3749712.1 unnamed protein product [Rotaria socialis]